MYRAISLVALIALLPQRVSHADPIHAIADGAYWHHASGWEFPESVGRYVRVGIPQDVAGSEDAVAYYAVEEGGVRHVASIVVYPANSAAAAEYEALSEDLKARLEPFPLAASQLLESTRLLNTLNAAPLSIAGVYFIRAGDWRVRIRLTGAELAAMDTFVREQRWDKLGTH